jgi:Uncharacterised nucleotidyltransferase
LGAVAEIGPAGREVAADLAAVGDCGPHKEFEFLLECCGQELDGRGAATISSTLQFDRVLTLADRHRVLPAVFAAVQDRNEVPVAMQNGIRAGFEKHARQNLRLSAEMAGILQRFRERGIEALPHKGAVLAQRLFGDAAMRQFGDLDFLIRAADVSRAGDALRELGYESNLQLSPRQEREYLRVGNEHVFGRDGGKNLIELQWQILPRFYSVQFDMEALVSRSVETEFQGGRVRVLGNEDLMLVLCTHAAKHEWEHLGMVRDIARLAQFDLDWQWIGTEARRLGIARILMISLLLTRKLLRCELPYGLRGDVQCEILAHLFETRLRTSGLGDLESLKYFRMMVRLREGWKDRTRFVWRLMVTPNVGEWKSVSIPDGMFAAYRGVRAARLMPRLFGRG